MRLSYLRVLSMGGALLFAADLASAVSESKGAPAPENAPTTRLLRGDDSEEERLSFKGIGGWFGKSKSFKQEEELVLIESILQKSGTNQVEINTEKSREVTESLFKSPEFATWSKKTKKTKSTEDQAKEYDKIVAHLRKKYTDKGARKIIMFMGSDKEVGEIQNNLLQASLRADSTLRLKREAEEKAAVQALARAKR
uniref:RxLR effector candidate protein n=2 Tax=Hyaloperonospora arabidopsidis (strain Emoy2) TaxID=559515 RepID=M4BK37_HYAAE|nr:RxLR effector candidate protein [Hyaloperonospora arabidopsidis Emoy2]